MPPPVIKSGRIFRRVQSFAWPGVGQAVIYDIPRGYDINALRVVVAGTITLATANAASVKTNSPSQLIERIDLFADGNKVFDQRNGAFAAVGLNSHQFATDLTVPTVATGAQTVRAVYGLDRYNYDGPRPKDSALHTQMPFMSLLQMRITTAASLLAPWDFSTTTTSADSLTIEIWLDETDEYNLADRFEGRFIRRTQYQSATVTAANSALQFQIPVGQFFKCARLIAYDGSGNYLDAPSDALLNAVKLESGLDVRYDMTYVNGRGQNALDYSVADGTIPTGMLIADVSPQNRLNELWDLRNRSEANLVIDHNAPSNTGRIAIEFETYLWQEGVNPPGA